MKSLINFESRELLRLAVVGLATAAALASAPAQALVVFIDQFTVTRFGNAIFVDDFADGVPPPSAPNYIGGNPTSYSVFGAGGIGPEANGKLRLDSSGGSLTSTAVGVPSLSVISRLLTNIDPLAMNAGLKKHMSFGATGLFDLPALFSEQSNFSIRLFERTQASISSLGFAQLRVARGTGAPFIDFRYQDYVADTITSFGAVPLDLTGDPDQIRLMLAWSPATATAAGAVSASFEYLKNGAALGGPITMAGTSDLFRNSDLVQAAFSVSETVIPLPAAAWLFGAGLLALAGAARGRRAGA